MSTTIQSVNSWNWGGTVNGFKMEIHVPKGAKAIYVGPYDEERSFADDVISQYPEEWELLLNRGTELKVVNIDRGKNVVEFEVVT